jgi:glucose-6-phosphate isomerase
MTDKPFTFNLPFETATPDRIDHHIKRHLSAMNGQFLDTAAYDKTIAKADPLLYEVYEIKRPEKAGELLHGVSIVHPGQVGDEFFMTKGHFHTIIDTAEIYYCMKGQGKMVMETPEGDWAVSDLTPGTVLYVPPRWAHRSVNTSTDEDLVTFFIYPGNAGHDYGTIEAQGFRKLVVERNGEAVIMDNPRWVSSEDKE